MHAPPKPTDIPVADAKTLEQYDAFLFGIPTRYGNFPAQWKAFWDSTGGQWAAGAFWGKYAGIFVSTGTPGGGQETTVITSLSTLTHHGIIYVPLGYKTAFPILANVNEVRGGSPWGAGTYAVSDDMLKWWGRICLGERLTNDDNRAPTAPANLRPWSSSLRLRKERALDRRSAKSPSDYMAPKAGPRMENRSRRADKMEEE
jgi:hypothetical protein